MFRYITEVALKYDTLSLHSHTPRTLYSLLGSDPKIKTTVACQLFDPNPDVTIKFSY